MQVCSCYLGPSILSSDDLFDSFCSSRSPWRSSSHCFSDAQFEVLMTESAQTCFAAASSNCPACPVARSSCCYLTCGRAVTSRRHLDPSADKHRSPRFAERATFPHSVARCSVEARSSLWPSSASMNYFWCRSRRPGYRRDHRRTHWYCPAFGPTDDAFHFLIPLPLAFWNLPSLQSSIAVQDRHHPR